MKKIYLCSRVAADARAFNNVVADELIRAGYEVYVPHRQPINNGAGSSDAEIYKQDMAAMEEADLCVAVARLGVDCAFECGWFQGRGKPILHYAWPEHRGNHPMFHAMWSKGLVGSVSELIERLEDVAA